MNPMSAHVAQRNARNIYNLAQKKGLTIRRNMFSKGWSVGLPNGSAYMATTYADLCAYVRGY
jgi:hypothetical protein